MKRGLSKHRPSLSSVVAALGAATIVLVGLIVTPVGPLLRMTGDIGYSYLDNWRYSPTTDFRPRDWQRPNRKYRYAVLDHVIAKVVVPGMGAAQVRMELGAPDEIADDGAWSYEAQRPGWHFIDFSGGGLRIEFDGEGRVVRVVKTVWID